MNDLFVELLSICIDRLADGDSVADCLADFPECPELGPLLETAAVLLVEARPGRPHARTAPVRGQVGDAGRGRGRSDEELSLPWTA